VTVNASPSHVISSVGDGKVTSSAVGAVTKNPETVNVAEYESAWALGAAKLKAKIRQSTAPTVLNRLGI